ncbi:membrane protein insertase YidC [Micromonospora aurantiaca]|uniref:Membrane protein insertase YidC n=1 Tax=Micromonospora aurantiaca (nom. illeg.) TaxID=47850 RepID=A0A1C6TJ18_9ACTN|nr:MULTISPECIES: membrane protein insertase YidC [Micromonospora]ADL48694.1 membrane protein insertase, YidC/Oxa1 family [Micromonospora aurantiaca ATCC 27029]AXH88903.1 membrane protein insertase YidC [Micromonospora aurantiaca]KAB1107965.1 membrane protein insertase YidC [Micromonospora aurantiaca]MBC9002988.1 membrane protein insertase YidC [Micromonospora aurantiaca]MDG4753995.1 membrane protein insertase YidC [Micromonospora sp. WMMD718]
MLAFAPLHSAASAAATVVTWLADVLAPLTGGAATAAAIVLFTVAVRLLISPLTVAQVRGERRRTALAPEVRELQRRYADDPARLQSELFALYRNAGASPVAGCLPALLQAPFFLVMYRLFATGDGAPELLGERLAGVPLGWHLGDGLAGPVPLVFGVLLAALLALAWWSSRRMRRAAAATGTVAGTPAEGPGAAVLGRVLPLLPYGTVLVALVVPLAAVLYLVTTTAWTALEQVVLRRPQPAAAIDKR